MRIEYQLKCNPSFFLFEMSNLYGYDDLTSEEVEPIDSDEEDQKRSSRNPDKSVKKKYSSRMPSQVFIDL